MTTNKTPDTGTPPADVEALIERLEKESADMLSLPAGWESTGLACGEAADTLRTLSAEVAALRESHAAAIEQARREERAHVASAMARIAKEHPGLMASAMAERAKMLAGVDKLPPTRTDIEREVRAQIVAELREGSMTVPCPFGYSETLQVNHWRNAANYIEANGREG